MSTQTTIESNELFIGGDWIKPQGSDRISVTAASTEELVGSVPDGTNADIDAAVNAARTAFDDPAGWSSWSVEDRAQALERLAAALESRAQETAHRVSLQNGMPISFALQVEAVFPAVLAHYYAGMIRQTSLQEDRLGLLGGTIHVVSKPVGVVGAIVPWNYPQTLAMFKLAPLLAAGCTAVIKPSPETVLDSLLLADAIIEAGLPPGVVNIVPAGREVGAYLVEHPGVDKVAFTGSTAAGRTIARRCGELLRPVTLELGGKSAAIVLDDADLSQATEALFAATLANNGQTCNIGTRILAPRARYDEVLGSSVLWPARLWSVTLLTRRPRSVHWQASGSASASRATSRRAAPRARACRRRWTPGGPGSRLVRAADDLRRREEQRHDRPRGDLRPGARRDPIRRRRSGGGDRQ